MIAKASQELKAILAKHLSANGLLAENSSENSIETFGAPRRLVAIASNVRLRQEDVTREIVGPPKSVAFDNVGEPTRAATSFAEKQGVPVSKLTFVDHAKGECLATKQVVIGQARGADPRKSFAGSDSRNFMAALDVLDGGTQSPRFIRPIRWIVALLDGKTIPFSFAGVSSTGTARKGTASLARSRFRSRGQRITKGNSKKNFVLPRPEARRKKIESEVRALTSRKGLRAHEDAGLLDLVTYLNEYPIGDYGRFRSEVSWICLEEILITVMRGHQKYFAVESRGGELAPHFLAVINLPGDPKRLCARGTRARVASPFCRCAILLGSRPESSLRRLPAEACRRDL